MNDQKRKNREYKAKERGSQRSYITEIENLEILLALEAGELSEGQAVKLIGVSRVELREMRNKIVDKFSTL